MRVLVTSEQVFLQTPDRAVWTPTQSPYGFWRRYLEVFDSVCVLARIKQVTHLNTITEAIPASGPGVEFAGLPSYIGPVQFLAVRTLVARRASQAVARDDAVLLRVPSAISSTLCPTLWKRQQPYAAEVLADPFEVFAPKAVRHWLRPLVRIWFTQQLRRQCRNAIGAAYITRCRLPERYPCPGFAAVVSDVEMPEVAYVKSARQYTNHQGRWRLITVGSLSQMYKGIDILVQAIRDLSSSGCDTSVTVVGDGRHRQDLERLAIRSGVGERFHFAGQLCGAERIREQLDGADLFVLPSRTEGLPRALVEAMARGLPCIGSDVGGIPELLLAEEMVRPGDARALSMKLAEVLADPVRLDRMSQRNLEQARRYSDEHLGPKRTAFYQQVWDATRAHGSITGARAPSEGHLAVRTRNS